MCAQVSCSPHKSQWPLCIPNPNIITNEIVCILRCSITFNHNANITSLNCPIGYSHNNHFAIGPNSEHTWGIVRVHYLGPISIRFRVKWRNVRQIPTLIIIRRWANKNGSPRHKAHGIQLIGHNESECWRSTLSTNHISESVRIVIQFRLLEHRMCNSNKIKWQSIFILLCTQCDMSMN